MNCYVPGHVLIFPETDGWEKHAGRIREIMPFPFEIIYSVEDMLEHYGLRDSISDLKHKFGSLPFVGRVPEGLEADASHQIRRIPDIKVALPDFLVAPTAVQLELNNAVIDSAINALSADPACPDCGTGVKIAVLDTGIDLAYLTLSSTSHILQFDAEQPQKAGQSPSDSFGHGTLVAHIKKIAPSSEIISVKVMGKEGTLGSVIAGIFLAEAAASPDIYNLSLSLRCDPEVCGVCGHTQDAAVNAAQVRLLFKVIYDGKRTSGRPILIAAAGNNAKRVLMPASFPEVLPVGAFDLDEGREASYARYDEVPKDRFILAPGGSREKKQAFGIQLSASWDRKPTFYGTSFAAAFVTGIAARYVCGAKGGPCGAQYAGTVGDYCEFTLNRLKTTADQSWATYTPDRHGMGLVKYQL